MTREVLKQLVGFFAAYPEQCFSKGQALLRPDDQLKHLFYIESGVINEYDIAASGNEIVVRAYSDHEILPLSSAINNSKLQFFYASASSSIVRQAPVDDFITYIKDKPQVLFELLACAHTGNDVLLRRLSHQMGGSALSQILFEITDNASRFGHRQINGDLKLTLNENEIAKRVGLSRETVNRNLSSFKKSGVIKSGATGITVTSLQVLEQALGQNL